MTHITFFRLVITCSLGFLYEFYKGAQHKQQNQNNHEPRCGIKLSVDIAAQIIPQKYAGAHREAEAPDVGNRLYDIRKIFFCTRLHA
jgi:hypothetical protein